MHAEMTLPQNFKIASVGSESTMGHSTAMHAFNLNTNWQQLGCLVPVDAESTFCLLYSMTDTYKNVGMLFRFDDDKPLRAFQSLRASSLAGART
jgi:hypothetical protein